MASAVGHNTVSGVTRTLAKRLHLDHHSSLPYYQQIVRQLIQLMDSGTLVDGDNLPAERVLAELLSVSRTTIKHCYDMLREENRLSTHGRNGTVVRGAPRINPELGRLKGFSEEMRELGMTPSTRVLQHATVNDHAISSLFGRPASAPFLKLVRLRLADGQPMSHEAAWFDLTLLPKLEGWDTSGSVYDFITRHCGVKLSYADQSIEAVTSSPEETKVFGFSAPGPCLLLKRRTYSSQQQLVEYVEGTFRGDAYTYRLKLKT